MPTSQSRAGLEDVVDERRVEAELLGDAPGQHGDAVGAIVGAGISVIDDRSAISARCVWLGENPIWPGVAVFWPAANVSTWLRPRRLARYIAQSALSMQVLLAVGVVGEGGDADAHRDAARRLAGDELGRRDLATDALGDVDRAGDVGVEEDDDELLAAVARRQVDVADRSPRGRGRRRAEPHRRRCGRGASLNALNWSRSQKSSARVASCSRDALDLLREALVQVAVVVEAGEAVGDRVERLATEALRGRLQQRREGLRDVAAQSLHLGRRPAAGRPRRRRRRHRSRPRSARTPSPRHPIRRRSRR